MKYSDQILELQVLILSFSIGTIIAGFDGLKAPAGTYYSTASSVLATARSMATPAPVTVPRPS